MSAPTTTPPPSTTKDFNILDPLNTWSILHWTVAGMGVVILLLLISILYLRRRPSTVYAPVNVAPDPANVTERMHLCPPDKRMQLLHRFV